MNKIKILPMTVWYNGNSMTPDSVNVAYAGMTFDVVGFNDVELWISINDRPVHFGRGEKGVAFEWVE